MSGWTARLVLAPNPGPMTLEGTNTWLLSAGGPTVVVDPGPDHPGHRAAVLAAAEEAGAPVGLVLLTHGHADHAEGAPALHAATGAPVRALDPVHRLGAEGLVDGDCVDLGDVAVRVLATPGHTGDSLSFTLPGPAGGPAAVLTGDTVLGRGTTVVAHPDGVLADYVASLRRLAALGPVRVLPGHGPELPDAAAVAAAYLAHRAQRLAQVAAALDGLAGAEELDLAVVQTVYADVDPLLWPAARLSVRAQLDHLRGGPPPDGWPPVTRDVSAAAAR